MSRRGGPRTSNPAVRAQAIQLVQAGCSQSEAARRLGITRAAVSKWVRQHEKLGDASINGLRPGPRGRRVNDHIASQARAALLGDPMDSIGCPLWSARGLQTLLRASFDTEVSRRTARRLLEDWAMYRIEAVDHVFADGGLNENDDLISSAQAMKDRVKDRAEYGYVYGLFWIAVGNWQSAEATSSYTLVSAMDWRRELWFQMYRVPFEVDGARQFLERLQRLGMSALFAFVEEGTAFEDLAQAGSEPSGISPLIICGEQTRREHLDALHGRD